MVTTRSATGGKGDSVAQAKLDDFEAGPKTMAKTKGTAAGRGQKRKGDGAESGQPPSESKAIRPSAANAAAIRGNTTVSPSLPETSKRRKPNAASMAPDQEERTRAGSGKVKPKVKSGGRNVGGEAKKAVQRQQRFSKTGKGGGEDEDEDREQQGEDEADDKKSLKMEKPIMINRSPALQLWGACVAQLLHGGKVEWESCLSMGAAIAALCAVSKGKSIGMIEPKDETDDQAAKKVDRKQKALKDTEEFHVMSFPLHVKNGKVMVSGAPKNVNEGQLIGKFGGQDTYGKARKAMESALESWQGHEDELNKKAFGMYEKFRPSVPAGDRGWGKKGELSLAQVDSVVRRS